MRNTHREHNDKNVIIKRVSKNFDVSSEGNLDRNSPDIML